MHANLARKCRTQEIFSSYYTEVHLLFATEDQFLSNFSQFAPIDSALKYLLWIISFVVRIKFYSVQVMPMYLSTFWNVLDVFSKQSRKRKNSLHQIHCLQSAVLSTLHAFPTNKSSYRIITLPISCISISWVNYVDKKAKKSLDLENQCWLTPF